MFINAIGLVILLVILHDFIVGYFNFIDNKYKLPLVSIDVVGDTPIEPSHSTIFELPTPVEDLMIIDLNCLTLKELKTRCKGRVKGYSKMSKRELVAKLCTL